MGLGQKKKKKKKGRTRGSGARNCGSAGGLADAGDGGAGHDSRGGGHGHSSHFFVLCLIVCGDGEKRRVIMRASGVGLS